MLCQWETTGVSLCSSLRALSQYPTPLLVSLSLTNFAPGERQLHGVGICYRGHRELSKYIFILLQDSSVKKIEHPHTSCETLALPVAKPQHIRAHFHETDLYIFTLKCLSFPTLSYVVCKQHRGFLSSVLSSPTGGQAVTGVGHGLEHVLSQVPSQHHPTPLPLLRVQSALQRCFSQSSSCLRSHDRGL